MLAVVSSATLLGVDGCPVRVEVHVGNGLPGLSVVGLPDAACRESRDRVRSALLSSGLPWPQRRVTVNLAPSALRKSGAGLDLAIAVGLLAASGELPVGASAGCGFLGELGLDGSVRPVPGTLPLVDALVDDAVVVPAASAGEASLVGRHVVRGVRTLREVVDGLRGDAPWPDPEPARCVSGGGEPPDLADVRGQPLGRWAVEVAAAGGHHLLLTGPPGAGKTMLAERLPGLLPPLGRAEALEATKIHSAAGLPLPASGLLERPPLRAPHHGASAAALVGGGTAVPRPGEVSLAHHGVLFLDEIAEVPGSVLDALRQPLEEGVIRVSRARATACFPARFLLVGAMNPCPCGLGGPPGSCHCSDLARARYHRRLSAPLLDRFDLRVHVGRPDPAAIVGAPPGEASAAVAARVAAARALAAERGAVCNGRLAGADLEQAAPLQAGAARLLEHRVRVGALSGRGVQRVRRVARTVADLQGDGGALTEDHVVAALALRLEPELLEAAG